MLVEDPVPFLICSETLETFGVPEISDVKQNGSYVCMVFMLGALKKVHTLDMFLDPTLLFIQNG